MISLKDYKDQDEFVKYKGMHVVGGMTYKLSFFATWEYKSKDVCFMRLWNRMRDWVIAGKGQFLYFDDRMKYIDYEKLETDINKLYGKYLKCTVVADKDDVLFELKELCDLDMKLAGCMYLSLFNFLRCTGNEYKASLENIEGSITSMYEGIIHFATNVRKAYGHSLNDGIEPLVGLYGDEIIPVIASHYVEIVGGLFSEESTIDLKTLTKFVVSNGKLKGDHYQGQTPLFGVLEDTYYAHYFNQ